MEVEDDIDDEIDPLSDPEERRVLYAALDSFRYDLLCFNITSIAWGFSNLLILHD